MIILYIPFSQTQTGNLADAARIWVANHSLYSTEEIQVIHHGEPLNDNLLEKDITVFVLAHGSETDPTIVTNFTDPATATIISTETLAERFNYDFLFIATRLEAIHLYCCGQEKKNALLAKKFEDSLLLLDNGEIKYYGGVIFTPDEKGNHWLISDSGIRQPAIANTHRFFRMAPSDSASIGKDIKSLTLEKYLQDCKIQRRGSAKQHGNSIRKDRVTLNRHLERALQNPSENIDAMDLNVTSRS
ncbi:hypothetical protein [Legionella clemsonensis]|uniref:RNA binding protein (Contains ribosomal protein S1 domain) n=1 Tax=Legionella clemsonensis TaxID=1867846 RepID=A0A222P6F8_9GAMM|nr:hypothetical protein [Legionella clemsonensis]ASQ47419.1 hypothetical protein clem_14465 [Legionella clemsonensis]